jgi:glycosyltransferase involved in cell wall biosynthesis
VPNNEPLLTDVGVLALVPDRWHLQWQPRHQVLTRLAHYFWVVWMNPPEPLQRSLLLSMLRSRVENRPVREKGFIVHNPSPFLPQTYSPRWLAELTLRRRLQNARRVLLRRGCAKTVLYLWRPEFAGTLQRLPVDLSCYHIDDEYSFSTVELPILETEAQLIANVDQVFIHSRALLEKKGGINPHTTFVPNGVDFEAYSLPVPEPADLSNIPRPRVGYSGFIKRQLNWPLLVELTAQHPEWSFVFVGARSPHPEVATYLQELGRHKNVWFLGAKTAEELAAYPQHFDVCIMPYRVDDYTKYIYPLKLHEYLAAGRPTVGAPIRSLLEFADVIALPATTEEWSRAIRDALATDTEDLRTKRQAVARRHDWQLVVRRIAETIAQRLGPGYSSRLEMALARESDAGSPDNFTSGRLMDQ